MNRITARAVSGMVAIGMALAGSGASGAPGAGTATVKLDPDTKPAAEAVTPAVAAPLPAPTPVMPAAPTGDALARQLTRVEDMLAGVDDAGQPCVEAGLQQNVRMQLTRVGRFIDDKSFREAVQGCDNMLGTPCSAGFRKAVKELSALLTAAAKGEQTRSLTEARAFLAGLPAACANAKTQGELQALQERSQQLQTDLSRLSSSGENQAASMLRDSLYSSRDGMREWLNLKAAEDAGDDIRVFEVLSRLSSSGSFGARGSPDVAKRLEALQAGMVERIDKTLAATREALLKATTAKEVQMLSSSFSRQMERLGRVTNMDSYAGQQVNALRSALNYWGRLLAAEERGDTQQALQTLGEMESESARQDPQLQAGIAAKREVLVRRALTQPSKADDPLVKLVADEMAKADTFEKLIDLRRRLATVQSPYASYSRYGGAAAGGGEVQALLADIQALENLQAAVQAGQFTQALQGYGFTGSGMHRWKPLVNQYFNMLRIKALRDLFQVQGLEIAPGQTVDQVLLQAADKAAAAGQWDRVARCLDAYRISMFGSQPAPTFLLDQIAACRAFLAAGNFEKAGDLERAATSYLLVLNAPAERTPVADALKQLARLRKEHPEVLEHLRGQPLVGPAPIPPAGGAAQPGLDVRTPMAPEARGMPVQ